MYVAGMSANRVYSYNMPDAIDARLAALRLSGVEIGEFSTSRTDYEGVVAEGVPETTVEAVAVPAPDFVVAVRHRHRWLSPVPARNAVAHVPTL